MFQFPRCPPGFTPVPPHHGRRVAPFGDPRIPGSQRLPGAFRRVGASFLGRARLGIPRAPILAVPSPPRRPAAPGRPAHPRGDRGEGAGAAGRRRAPRARVVSVRAAEGGRRQTRRPRPRGLGGPARTLLVKVQRRASRAGRPGGAAGARTPDLRRARAALSRLSYGPPPRPAAPLGPQDRVLGPRTGGGRAWTRTRGLGLIRAAL